MESHILHLKFPPAFFLSNLKMRDYHEPVKWFEITRILLAFFKKTDGKCFYEQI